MSSTQASRTPPGGRYSTVAIVLHWTIALAIVLQIILAGRMELGTWQSVVLVDTNRDNPDRHVRLSFLS